MKRLDEEENSQKTQKKSKKVKKPEFEEVIMSDWKDESSDYFYYSLIKNLWLQLNLVLL